MKEDFFTDKTTIADVQAALDKGAVLTERDKLGANPVHFALGGKAPVEVIKFLVEQGAPLKQPEGKKGEPVTNSAVSYGNVELMKWLQEKGADFTLADDIGEGGLHNLCYADHFDPAVLEFLLAVGGDANQPDHQNQLGETIAMNVVWSEADNAEALLDAYLALGADPSGVRSEGYDAFMAGMAWSDSMKMVERFYGFSEDPHARDNEGRDALLMTAEAGMTQEKYDWLIAHEFDPMAEDDAGANAMVLAGASGKPESLKFWTDLGMDIDSQNDKGQTALLHAMEDRKYASPAMVRALVDQGADVNLADEKGVTPILELLAVELEEPSEEDARLYGTLLPFLIEKGADPKAVDASGKTALFYAVSGHRSADVVKQLIDLGADVNAKDNFGSSALMEAVLTTKDPAVLDVFIAAGADTSVRDEFDDPLAVMAEDNAALKGAAVLTKLQ